MHTLKTKSNTITFESFKDVIQYIVNNANEFEWNTLDTIPFINYVIREYYNNES